MKKYLKIVLLLLWCLLIFSFSAQGADESSNTTNIVVELLYGIYAFIFRNHISLETFNNLIFGPIRKIAHFSEYMVLGIIAYLHVKDYRKDKTYILPIIFSCLYATSDELHQYFVPGRACTLKDICIDSCGAILGILLMHKISKRCKK